MKKKAIVIGGTCNDFIPMGVFVINVKNTNLGLVDEIIIFHDGILEEYQIIFNKIFPCRFIYYSFPGYDPDIFNEYVNKYFTPMVFCRYECLKLLNEYSVIMWSDYDVVILKDLSELLEPCHSGIKLIKDDVLPQKQIKNTLLPSINEIGIQKYNLSKEALSSAIIILYDSLNNYLEMYDWCIKTTKAFGRHLYLTELSIFNLLLQEFNIEVETVNASMYCPHPINGKINIETKIMHAYGQPKFWNGLKIKEWEDNYHEWLKIGGPRLKERSIFYKTKKIITFTLTSAFKKALILYKRVIN